MEYKNFNLRIEPKLNDGYPVVVEADGVGQETGSFVLSPECLALAAQLKNLNAANSVPMDLGVSLYKCLFDKNVGRILDRSLGTVNDSEQGLRIRLRLSPAEIAALPWEVLYDQQAKCFLATSDKTPITRYIELAEPIKALTIEPPVRVLALIPGGSGLDTEEEEKILREALATLGSVELRVLRENVTRCEISRALVEDQYHILHFIGHGSFENQDGQLFINGEDGSTDRVPSATFADFFRNHPSLKLVVLNACQGAEVASTVELAGVAPQLVARGIPAVVAMQYPISDEAALVFAREFYLKLCSGWSRGQIDMAISHARNRIWMDVKDEAVAFATPVLFLRSPTGIIFDLKEEDPGKLIFLRRIFSLFSSVPAKNVTRLKEIKQTREKNIESWQERAKDSSDEVAKEASDAILHEQEEIEAVDRRIVQWNRALLASLLSMLIVLFMSFVGLFEVAGADSWLERRLIPYMDNFTVTNMNENVRVIIADDDANGGLGTPGPSWRKYHADLINALAGKAKVIAFDLRMSLTTDQDELLAKAIQHAEQSGTHVVLVRDFTDEGKLEGDLVDRLRTVVGDRWGNTKVGALSWGFIRSYQLAQSPRDGSASTVAVPSLALQSVAQFISPNSSPKMLVDSRNNTIEIRGDRNLSVPVYEASPSIYDLGYSLINSDDIKSATRSYRTVYERLRDESFLREFQGKLVLVGFKTPSDYFRVYQGEQRYGTEIHANVMSNMLSGIYIRFLPAPLYFLTVAAMVAVGVVIRARFSHVFSITFTVPFTEPKKSFDLPGLLFVADVIYLLVGFLLFKFEHIYMVKTYHLVAPFIAYWLTGKLRKRTSPRAPKGVPA